MGENWRDNAGPALLGQDDPYGNPLATPLDRRWLWRIENSLAVSAGNDVLKDLAHDLRQYLGETCEHHWLHYAADEDPEGIGAHRQCLWCNDAVFGDDPDSHYVTFYGNAVAVVLHPKPHCLPDAETGVCAYQDAVDRSIDCGAPVAGRWRIDGISEGLPELERADEKSTAPAA